MRPVLEFAAPDAAAMQTLGRRLAGMLRAGDLLVLDGPLGAGKTTFTRGLGEGLGVRGAVTSPTFVIARVHPGPIPLVHVDAYRLSSWAELEDLDLEHDLDQAVTVVEWGAGLVEPLVEHPLLVRIQRPTGAGSTPASSEGQVDEQRVVLIEGDETWDSRVAAMTR